MYMNYLHEIHRTSIIYVKLATIIQIYKFDSFHKDKQKIYYFKK